jgi:hypothetical protein
MTGKMLLQLISFMMFIFGILVLVLQNWQIAAGVLLIAWAYRVVDVAEGKL